MNNGLQHINNQCHQEDLGVKTVAMAAKQHCQGPVRSHQTVLLTYSVLTIAAADDLS